MTYRTEVVCSNFWTPHLICVKLEYMYIVENDFKGRWNQVVIILRKYRKDNFGKSDMTEAFLRQEIQSLQVELLNLQTHINSGYIVCIFGNLICRNRETYKCT